MNLREFADKTGMDLNGTLERFMNMEPLMLKFIRKFSEDPTFFELKRAVECKDYEKIERSAHTLKGVAGNLGFNELFKINQDIVDAVRQNNYEDVDKYFLKDEEMYTNIVECVRELD